MTATAAKRAKFAEQSGRMPTLQFCRPAELHIDPSYQRSTADAGSHKLIQRIAEKWNWDLCQPLVVSRRRTFIDQLFVIDGQHRLQAARLRGDIDQLPCVILNCDDAAQEAEAFVQLNASRKPLKRLDVFRASVQSGSPAAQQIMAAIEAAGLQLAPHDRTDKYKPGWIACTGAMEDCLKRHGPLALEVALSVLAQAYPGQVLQYAGTMFPGVAAWVGKHMNPQTGVASNRLDRAVTKLGERKQGDWYRAIHGARADNINLSTKAASAQVIIVGLDGVPPISAATRKPAAFKSGEDRQWCDQCDQQRSAQAAGQCASAFCKLKVALA